MSTNVFRWRTGAAALAATAILLTLCGCPPTPEPPPPPPVENQPPIANAGEDQNVAVNSLVTLNGTQSFDPEGGPLTYFWTQIAGPIVALANPTSPTPTFTAPPVATTLRFQLLVVDTNLLAGLDDVTIAVFNPAPPTAAQRLWIANAAGANVNSYADPNTLNGNALPTSNLFGNATQFISPADILIDNSGRLVVADYGAGTLSVFADAANLNGIFAPLNVLEGAPSGLFGPVSVAQDPISHLVFVLNQNATPASITVYDPNVIADPNGSPTTLRTITSPDMRFPTGMNFDANGTLYVACPGRSTIAIFENAGALPSGSASANRVLLNNFFLGIFDVFVDQNDTLYVLTGSIGGNRVLVFPNASGINGPVAATTALTVAGAINLTSIAVDSLGVGYIVDSGNNAIYVYDNIAVAAGLLLPDREITGPNTQLDGPIRLFLQR